MLQQFVEYQVLFSPKNGTNTCLLDIKGSTHWTSCELLQTMNYFRSDFQTYERFCSVASSVAVTVLNLRDVLTSEKFLNS